MHLKYFNTFQEYLIREASNQNLQGELNKWNKNYSQYFKFKNDEPSSNDVKSEDEPEGQLQTLLSVIVEQDDSELINTNYKNKVSDAVKKLAELLSNEAFKNKEVEVIGHTSTPASDQYNKQLSVRRSQLVVNAILDVMQQKDIENHVKFKITGKGEEKPIIKNDQTTRQKPIISSHIEGKFSKEEKEVFDNSKKARQLVNRRVVISLPEFSEKEVKPDVEEIKQSFEDEFMGMASPKGAEQEKDENTEKPEAPEPTEIKFNYNSYHLTSQTENLLKQYGENIKKWNENHKENTIDELYILSHTNKPQITHDTEFEEKRERMLFVLSANRGLVIKKFFKDYMDLDIECNVIPVAYTMPNPDGTNKRVEIFDEKNDHVMEAKNNFIELSKQFDDEYDIKEENGYYENNNIITNYDLRELILYNIENSNVKAKKRIPVELWYEDEGKHEKNLKKFRSKVKNILEWSDEDLEEYVIYDKK